MFVRTCALEMIRCQEIDTIVIPDVCERFSDRGKLYTPVFDKIQPPLKCPLKKVQIRVRTDDSNSWNDFRLILNFSINCQN